MLLSQFTEDLIEAGVDEAGRGCLAGSVVAAAVILPKNYQNEYLRDSKKLNKKQRLALEEIIKKEALHYAISEVLPQKIDEINILQASFLAMHLAIEQLEIKPEFLLIDGNRFKPFPKIKHQCVIKGDDKYLAIAAASVLAKTHRDRLMENLAKDFPNYLWQKNMGYPTKFHYQAIQDFGITDWHRRSFRLF
ncbi:MAG: ribonuclease HII [Bacteroidetes bacterium]|nr:MAG: ribonuclease HII [Bacteroidota bacterium]